MTRADPWVDTGKQLYLLLGETGINRFKDYTTELPGRSVLLTLSGQAEMTALSAEQSASLSLQECTLRFGEVLGGDNENRNVVPLRMLLYCAKDFEAVHLGHQQIEQDCVNGNSRQ